MINWFNFFDFFLIFFFLYPPFSSFSSSFFPFSLPREPLRTSSTPVFFIVFFFFLFFSYSNLGTTRLPITRTGKSPDYHETSTKIFPASPLASANPLRSSSGPAFIDDPQSSSLSSICLSRISCFFCTAVTISDFDPISGLRRWPTTSF